MSRLAVLLAVLLASALPPALAADPHAEVLARSRYPSAAQCKKCHGRIYREWSMSSHAYAGISPVFHKFEQKINDLSRGTIGSFCVRCHLPVGTALGERRELPLWERAQASREGVTCVSCHRAAGAFGRVNGERTILSGDIHAPILGNSDGAAAAGVVADADAYKVRVSPSGRFGVPMHAATTRFPQLSSSEFCLSCHQVAVHPGIKLEVVWDQYRASPAARAGTRCQDCHMGKVPGKAEGFEEAPAAEVDGQALAPRPHHDHSFFGPGYPVAHPGLFPHSGSDTSVQDWLAFDHRAGWGKADFEDQVEAGTLKAAFPEPWSDRIAREEARAVVEANLAKLIERRELRRRVMENGSALRGPFFRRAPALGRPLRFHYVVENTNPGHNLPSGSLGAQPEIWLNVALIGPDGKSLWESGYVDALGDMADLHSLEVARGAIPHDGQLFNLQTKFLTTNLKGTDREAYLPINFDVDQLPLIRPASQPVSVLNHPPLVRMEGRSLPPLASRKAAYAVPSALLARPGTYRLAARLRSRAEPIYFMRFIGSTPEMERAMNEWMLDVHPRTVAFEVR